MMATITTMAPRRCLDGVRRRWALSLLVGNIFVSEIKGVTDIGLVSMRGDCPQGTRRKMSKAGRTAEKFHSN